MTNGPEHTAEERTVVVVGAGVAGRCTHGLAKRTVFDVNPAHIGLDVAHGDFFSHLDEVVDDLIGG